MAAFLLEQFELDADALYQEHGPVNLVRLMQVPDWVDRPDLKFPPFVPALPARLAKHEDIFAQIRKGDILLHHPFESFQPVIDFIEQAAADPNVVAMRQTVYRTGTDSKLMQALIRAAQSGKEVTVVVELMARFDEEANINWAAKLEEVGAHVIYGVVGHKTHAKLALVIRREEGELRRYAHLGTGNYHARTARLYTDFGLLTCDEAMTADVGSLFTQITGLGKAGKLKRLWQSPFTLHSEVVAAINHEAELAAAGKPAAIVAKMNALLEPQVIAALYAASQAGVKIDLIVRGVCALRPGIAGLSEQHPGALDRRPLPRTHAHLLFQERRRRTGLSVVRRLDGPQLLPPHRNRLPRPQPQAQKARHRRRPQALPARQRAGLGDAVRRQLPPPHPAPRQALLRADRTAGAADQAEIIRADGSPPSLGAASSLRLACRCNHHDIGQWRPSHESLQAAITVSGHQHRGSGVPPRFACRCITSASGHTKARHGLRPSHTATRPCHAGLETRRPRPHFPFTLFVRNGR